MTPDKIKKTERTKSIIKGLAADYICREWNGTSLITVTDVQMSDDRKYANILLSVFPSNEEAKGVEFARKNVGDFAKFVENHSKIGVMPRFNFQIDFGEKNRQKIEDLSRKG